MERFYGYGVIDKDRCTTDSFDHELEAEEVRIEFDELFPEDSPHRVVKLFYKDAE